MMRYLILIFILTSCSHSITLNPKGCYSKGFVKSIDGKVFTVEKNILSFGDTTEQYLEEILKSNNIDCRKVKNMNYTFKSSLLDSIVSILPFIERKTFVINYSEL